MKLAPKFRGASHQHLLFLGCIKNPDGYCELERVHEMVHAFRGINGLDCHRSSQLNLQTHDVQTANIILLSIYPIISYPHKVVGSRPIWRFPKIRVPQVTTGFNTIV